MSKLSLV